MTKLTAHRVYKKNEAMSIHHGFLQAISAGNGSTLPAVASFSERNRAMMDTVRGTRGLILAASHQIRTTSSVALTSTLYSICYDVYKSDMLVITSLASCCCLN